MKVLSPSLTFVTKYVIPGFWFLYLFMVVLTTFATDGYILWPLLVVAIVILMVSRATIGKYQKVSLVGNDLVVSNYFRSESVPLHKVNAIVGHRWISTRHIHIEFEEEISFGKSVLFMPKMNLNVFKQHPVISELRLKIASVKSNI